jgi:tetratricopeptide (TPR) repeat protein
MKFLYCISLALFSLTGTSQKYALDSVSMSKLVSRAYQKTNHGAYQEAISILNKITEIDTNSTHAFLWKGALFYLLNDSSRAVDNYIESLEINQTKTIEDDISNIFDSEMNAESHQKIKFYKAFTAYKLKKYALAIKEIDRLNDWTRDHPKVQNYSIGLNQNVTNATKSCFLRGNSSFYLNDFDDAIKNYNLVIKRDSLAIAWNEKQIEESNYPLYISRVSSFTSRAHYKKAQAKQKCGLPFFGDYQKSCELGLMRAGDSAIVLASKNPAFKRIQFTPIPDSNFEKKLIELGIDDKMDGKVLTSKIEKVKKLDVFGSDIADLKGIERFISLKKLVIGYNPLEALDLSKNTSLMMLSIDNDDANCYLGNLDLKQNIALTELIANGFFLTELDVRNNIHLERITISSSSIGKIDLSLNTELVFLEMCRNEDLNELDLSRNSKLKFLKVQENYSLQKIYLNPNLKLKKFYCSENNFDCNSLNVPFKKK